MKNLKALLAAYRTTTPNTTAALASSVEDALSELEAIVGNGGLLRIQVDRVQKILGAVIADMRAEDAKTKKDMASDANNVTAPPVR